MRRRALYLPVLMIAAVLAAPAPAGAAVRQAQPSSGQLVSAVPAGFTPNVLGGLSDQVNALAPVGAQMVVGGNFTSGVQPAGSSASQQLDYLFAINASTGAIAENFRPSLNGQVLALLAGPTLATGDHTVYVGGKFTEVDGQPAWHLALLDLTTGAPVPGFRPPAFNGIVDALATAHGLLIVGGRFTEAGDSPAGGIVALAPSSGARSGYITFSVSGHHNWSRGCQECAPGSVGVEALAVAPSGNQMVIIGDFTRVGGYSRNQLAMILLGSQSATVDSGWATQLYDPACYYWAYDSYVRDVAFSPGGGYFVVTATGGGGKPHPGAEGCDSVARFSATSQGQNVLPAWVDYTGDDTLDGLVVSSSAIYVGGHNRWLNNPNGSDYAGAGAVPRPGLAALDPVNGLPFSWNPGRNPRGYDVYTMVLTPAGLWFGSDTNYVGAEQYLRERLTFFPASGGQTVAATREPGLPDPVYLGDRAGLSRRQFHPHHRPVAGPRQAMHIKSGIDWALVHGTFMLNGYLYYLCAPAGNAKCDAASDQGLFRVPFNGSSFGTSSWVAPFDDPYWDHVATGSGGATPTYQGKPPPLYAQAASVSGLTYAGGQLYYTVAGKAQLYRVAFEPQDGIVGATAFTAPSATSFARSTALFTAGNELYWVDASGQLQAARFTSGVVSGRSVAIDRTDTWSATTAFIGP
jgi:hypothetical protein